MTVEQESKEIEYEFEDLRRNEDPLPESVATHFDTDDTDDAGGTDDDDGDDDGKEMVSRKDMDRKIAKIRRESDRKIETAKTEAGDELVAMQKRLGKIEETDAINELDVEQTSTVERINKGIEEAMEAGDSKAVTKLTTELAEATATNVTKREALKRAADEHDEPDDLNKPSQESRVIPRAKDWLAEQDWWEDSDNAHIKRFVNRLDANLQEKGYSPHDDDFYEQLEEAVEKKYPGVITHTMDDDLDDDDDNADEFSTIPSKRKAAQRKNRQAANRQPVGGKDAGTGGKPRNRQRGKTLSRDRIANMRMFGMDPDNKEHVEAYLAEVNE